MRHGTVRHCKGSTTGHPLTAQGPEHHSHALPALLPDCSGLQPRLGHCLLRMMGAAVGGLCTCRAHTTAPGGSCKGLRVWSE